MAGLVLKLRAGERVLVNGAVLECAGRPARLRVLTPQTDILRMRDAIDPTEAQTPVGRLTHVVQMMVAGAVPRDAAAAEARAQIAALREAFLDSGDLTIIQRVADHLAEDRTYPALRMLRELHEREAHILAHAADTAEPS